MKTFEGSVRMRCMNARIAGFALVLALAGTVSAQDFTLTLQPSSLTLIPNQKSSLVVSMTPLNGFTSQVALAVGTLPSGVTGQFSPQTLALPGTSILTLTAATNAALGSFTLDISASGGGITNTTSSSVTVNFGLLPICAGAFAGQVTDAQTGLPVPNALVTCDNDLLSVHADTNGIYTLTNAPLGLNNSPNLSSLQAFAPGYWASAEVDAYAVCDATNTVDLKMVLEEYGSISGTVSIQGGGPAVGVLVTLVGSTLAGTNSSRTDSNGYYEFIGVILGFTNSPAEDYVSSGGSGGGAYWPSSSNAVVRANSNTVVNLVIVPWCYGTVTGSVFYGDTQLPAANAIVSMYGGLGINNTRTDGNGNYSFTNIVLDPNGTLSNTAVGASPPGTGYNAASVKVTVPDCGATVTAPPIYLPAIPRENFDGAASGHIYDLQTGLPIDHATVQVYSLGGYSYTVWSDTNGAYSCTNMAVGTGAATNAGYVVSATATGYFGNSSNIVVYANLTTTQDVYLLRIGYGGVMGTVRDSATTLPLTNVTLIIGTGSYLVEPTTDANGHYFSGPLPLGYPNGPTYVQMSASPPGYYEGSTNTTITLGVTNVVNLDLIKVCTGATIIGTVVNAQTQQPITNATLYVTGSPYYFHTDTNGSFIMTNITVGNDNSPIQETVYASAPGFNSQSKTVTVFCDATITTDFGAPQTAFAIIQGLVTNVVTGLPMAGVFMGSQFGEAALTDTNGFYQLTQAPLGANNSSRTWNITAIPTNFTAQTLPVTVSSNAVSTLNFGFGEPPTALMVTAVGAPDPVTVGGELLYVVTLTNTVANARQVQLSDTLPPGVTFLSAAITNSPGSPFSAPLYSNNIVTTTAADFGSNSAVALAIAVRPAVPGMLTNAATVSSTTTDLDPTGSNHTATVITTVLAPAAPTALIVAVQATPAGTILVGSNLLYTITLTNTTANAANVQLADTLPASVGFVSASVSNSPGGQFSQPLFSNGAVTTSAASFGSNSAVVLFITVTPGAAGTLTNVASVTTTTTNLAAGSTLSTSVITTVVAPAAPTALIVTLQATPPRTLLVGSNLLYTVTLTNTTANAADVQLVDTLPASVGFVSASVSNSPGGQFSQPVFSNGAVTTSAGSFGSNSAVVLFITVTPGAAGTLTNVASATTTTTNLAAGTTLSASVVTTVVAPAAPTALIVAVQATPPGSVLVGSNLLYTVTLTNSAANAGDVWLTDILPPGVTFLKASVTNNPGGAFSAPTLTNNVVTTMAANFSPDSTAVLLITVTPTVAGNLTNVVTVTSDTPDRDPTGTNHAATVTSTVVPPVASGKLSIQFSPATFNGTNFNHQTGLYEQTVQVNNLSGFTAAAVRVAVLDLPSSVKLYNATGTTNGAPYVEYDQPVATGSNVVFVLEYYDSTREAFVSTNFLATIVAPVVVPAPAGTSFLLDTAPFMSQGQLTIEFASVPGHTYVVQYSSDMRTWQTATPPIVAEDTRTQWIDAGPPETESPPGSPGQRFYRIVQTN
jgi:uncharacterized repeat protein (TIGR01451 family)